MTAPRTWTLEEPLATNSMVGNRVPAAMLPGASASWSPTEVSRIKPVVVLHLSDLLPVLTQSDDGVNAATRSTIPRETLWRVNRHHRQLRIDGTNQESRRMASQENCATIPKTLPHGSKSRILTRKSPTKSLRCDDQVVACWPDDPHMAHLGPAGPR